MGVSSVTAPVASTRGGARAPAPLMSDAKVPLRSDLCDINDANGAFPLHGTVRLGTVRYGTVRLSSRRFAFPLQFSTAIEWAGLFTRRYNCAASTGVTSSRTRHKQTHNKERRRNSVLHSRHVDVFKNNGEVYENAWDLPPAAETVVTVTRAVDEESRCAALLD